MTSPPATHTRLHDATRGEVLRASCDACGITSDLMRLPASLDVVLALIKGFERGHAACAACAEKVGDVGEERADAR